MKIPQIARSELIEMLHQTLAPVIGLKTHIKQAQWNPQKKLYQPHAIYDEMVAIMEEYIDFFAASLVALSRVDTKTDCLKSSLNDSSNTIICIKNRITALATRLEPYARLLQDTKNYQLRT